MKQAQFKLSTIATALIISMSTCCSGLQAQCHMEKLKTLPTIEVKGVNNLELHAAHLQGDVHWMIYIECECLCCCCIDILDPRAQFCLHIIMHIGLSVKGYRHKTPTSLHCFCID